MMSRPHAWAWVPALLILAACGGDPSSPTQDAVENPYNITLQQRPVELLDSTSATNVRSFPLPAAGADPEISMAKGRGHGAEVVFRGLAQLSPPRVAEVELQITDLRIDGDGRGALAVAVANVAGETVHGALQLYLLHDLEQPELAAEALLEDAEYNSVVVHHEVAYAMGNDLTGAIVDAWDLSDPHAPALRQRLPLAAFTALAGQVDDGSLYVVSGDNGGLHRLDLADRLHPTAADFVAIEDARDVAGGQRHLLVLDAQGVVEVDDGSLGSRVDVPGLPALAPSRGARSQHLWYLNTTAGIAAIDLKDLDIAWAAGPGEGTHNGLATDGDRFFFRANGEGGLQLLYDERKKDGSLTELGVLDFANAGSSNSAEAGEGFLLSGDGRGGVLICAMDLHGEEED